MEIKETTNYEIFKFRKENRLINYKKVDTMKKDIMKIGRQILPIICSKNMEIIDGQHRFVALKELNLPIKYYIDDNVVLTDLITINNTQKNWSINDYLHFYSELGNENYIKLEQLYNKYNVFPIRVILNSLGDRYTKESAIKTGNISFTDEEFIESETILEFISNIKNNIKQSIIEPRIFFALIIKTYRLPNIDKERLSSSIIERYGTENYGNSIQCAQVIEHWYNHKLRTYRYISNEILPRR